ncbi:hypothetical protein SAMN05192574_104241 [Mucilaginibacter gossypiicola]|uniref:Uncharacterized protein n=1 Tax=Mucilaginibacter gossypiicola TaxID=551995 RepID=A0A1H8JLQ4_9SPHI|nr:hypothetical protein [Mucilaginibacter gossypiicola]SEN81693.1 hypothetical protein SAMN05192574_104241 [Mucilaginibacter gossypiicola]
MSVSIGNLALDPQQIHAGTTSVNLTYEGFVTKASDNDVDLTFSICPNDTNIFIVDDKGKNVKSISYSQTFKVGAPPGDLSKSIKFIVLNAPAQPVICVVELVATTANGTDSDKASGNISYS